MEEIKEERGWVWNPFGRSENDTDYAIISTDYSC